MLYHHQLSFCQFAGMQHAFGCLFRNCSSPALYHVAPKFNFRLQHIFFCIHCCLSVSGVFDGRTLCKSRAPLDQRGQSVDLSCTVIENDVMYSQNNTGNFRDVSLCTHHDHLMEDDRILWD